MKEENIAKGVPNINKLSMIFIFLVVSLYSKIYAFENDGSWHSDYFYGTKNPLSYYSKPTDYGPTRTIACSNAGGEYNSTVGGCFFAGHPFGVQITRLSCSTKGYHPETWKASGCGTHPESEIQYLSRSIGLSSCLTGNPISISTGNKYQQETLLAGALPLQLSYNSLDQRWRNNYSYRLNVNSDEATLVRSDGKGFAFSQGDSVWTANDTDVFFTLTALDNGAGSAWQVTIPDGSTELYDNEGQLLSITNLQGQTVNLVYAQNQIQIRDEFENTLQLNVNADGQLTSASLNGTVQAQLNTDADGRLLSRTDAAGQTITYHYENTDFPKHLTGITGADGVRFATWTYDDQGRGILSEHAGQERATLVFNDDDSTTVTNSLGKQTTYRFELIQGLKRPVAIEGHATENCVAANKAYTYHANGLVETQTDWSGNITRFEYNDRGLVIKRTEAEGTPAERVIITDWHSELPLRVQQTISGIRTEYNYDAANRLLLIKVKSN